MRIAVYVTLFGNYDSLKPVPAEYRNEAYYFLFTDCITESDDYIIIPVSSQGHNLRRLSREIKIFPFERIPGFDYYIYLDATITLNTSPRLLIEKYLSSYDIAVLKHPWRDCVYDEMRECLRLGITDWDLTHEQARYYRSTGYPEHNGLTENGVILRKNNYRMQTFSEHWLRFYKRYAERDQFSFCFIAWLYKIQFNLISNNIRSKSETKEFNFKDHPR